MTYNEGNSLAIRDNHGKKKYVGKREMEIIKQKERDKNVKSDKEKNIYVRKMIQQRAKRNSAVRKRMKRERNCACRGEVGVG